jgi:hypothetical protein
MPSCALALWSTVRARELDEIKAAPAALRGTGHGRRVAIQQLHRAYAVLLASQFQGFCRELHSEAADHFTRPIPGATHRTAAMAWFSEARKLDVGNPNPGNLGADFGRFGLQLWPALKALSPRTVVHQRALDELNLWRNAIAHNDFTRLPVPPRLTSAQVQRWRRACDHLARALDRVVARHLKVVVGVAP